MRNVLIITDKDGERTELSALFEGADFAKNGSEARDAVKRREYDLVIAPPNAIAAFRLTEPDSDEVKNSHIEKIFELFTVRGGAEECIRTVKQDIYGRILDSAKAEKVLCEIYSAAIDRVFEENEWLELYEPRERFAGEGSAYLKERLTALLEDFTALFPAVTSDTTEKVILHILNNPESDLRQKTIASIMYVNSSYLSTVFAAQTGERFVDYLTGVKLRRAAYLLMNSSLRVGEIAARLDYKDIGYFSRIFKVRYGIPPSEYRVPDNYTYVI